MTDLQIRTAFHNSILRGYHSDASTFVLNELGLRNGLNRADIAVLNGKMIGYEIKTEGDSLSRLPAQVVAYNEVFDKAFIITADKHLQKVKQQIPKWWGIYTIHLDNSNDFAFSCHRDAHLNKMKNSYAIARLLWKAELEDFLGKTKYSGISKKKNKNQLYEIVANKYSAKYIGEIALKYLKARQNWRINSELSL